MYFATILSNCRFCFCEIIRYLDVNTYDNGHTCRPYSVILVLSLVAHLNAKLTYSEIMSRQPVVSSGVYRAHNVYTRMEVN